VLWRQVKDRLRHGGGNARCEEPWSAGRSEMKIDDSVIALESEPFQYMCHVDNYLFKVAAGEICMVWLKGYAQTPDLSNGARRLYGTVP
jgi:hypothetical protein